MQLGDDVPYSPARLVGFRVDSVALYGASLEHCILFDTHTPGSSALFVSDSARIDPRININNQPWSLPVVFTAQTASLRWRQRLAADWQFTAHGAVQELRNDDRAAFPFGCTDAASGTYYMDRYCPDGSLDLYDYRSEGERRRVVALDLGG